MLGLMQDWPLTLDKILDHAKRWHPNGEIVTRSVEGPIVRTTYAQVHERAKRLTSALLALGIKPGDRVATLAWNTGRHLETWYAIMGMGAICHTLNPRLFETQLCYIINHAQDRLIFTDLTFLPVLLSNRENMPSVAHIVVLTDEAHMPKDVPGLLCLETLIERHSAEVAWGGFDENTAAGLCYTSGTTGNPKGVLYSHRSNFLHTLMSSTRDVMGVSARDAVLAIVPMFHANAWGLTFSVPAVGAKLVLPGMKLDGASVHELLESEGVTFSAAVPTVWLMLLQHLRATGGKLTTLKRVLIGGSAVPEAIVRVFGDEYGVEVVHAWGMTETSPLGVVSQLDAETAALSPEEQMPYRLKQGRPPLGMDLKLTDETGARLPHDGASVGALKVKGPFVARAYFRGEGGDVLDGEGFFDTGDMATIDDHGFMQITDRSKDVIKSGGEWISSIDVENAAVGHAKAELCAVIGVAHPKWDERPLLLVKLKPGESGTREEFLDFLQGKIAKWWIPDDVLFVDDIPLGATGKIDKKALRARHGDHVLPTISALDAVTRASGEVTSDPEEGAAQTDRPFPDEASLQPAAPVSAPAQIPGLGPRARFGRLYLRCAVALAAAPLVLLTAAMLGSIFGLVDWTRGFGAFAVAAGRYLALTSVVGAIVGLFVALACGFSRLWGAALAALALSAATTGGFVAVRQHQLTRPPLDETVADLAKPG